MAISLLIRKSLIGVRSPSVKFQRLFQPSCLINSPYRLASSLSQQFEEAKTKLNSLQNEPGNDVKLKIYGLFKQASVGKCNTKQPGVFDIVGRTKWTSWNTLGDMSQEKAREEYVSLINNLVSAESGSPAASVAHGSYKTIKVTQDGCVKTIILNRASKKNAINLDMYDELCSVLGEAGRDPKTVVTVITGDGDYYCSGNDLSNFMAMTGANMTMDQMCEHGGSVLKKFVSTFIDFPKILVGLINGPAVGISVTVLGLFDAVLATDAATFHTPFSALGQSAEGCSSFVFPQLMGFGKANEMLLFNKKLTATEAHQLGLVTQVFPAATFQKEAWEKVKAMSSNPPNSMLLSKNLIKGKLRQKLHEINEEETKLLIARWQSDECLNAITNFMQRKSSL